MAKPRRLMVGKATYDANKSLLAVGDRNRLVFLDQAQLKIIRAGLLAEAEYVTGENREHCIDVRLWVKSK